MATPQAGRASDPGAAPMVAFVITGPAGGPLGGNSGAAFGSGMTSFTQQLAKLFSPNLEAWARCAAEDKQMHKEQRVGYRELSEKQLARDAALEKFKRKSRDAANAAFLKRQENREADEKAEAARVRKERHVALAKPTLGDPDLGTAKNRQLLESRSVLDETAVAKWLWPTQKQAPFLVVKGLGAEHEDAMTTLPPNASEATVQTYVTNITSNTHYLTRTAAATRKHKDEQKAANELKEKKTRADDAIAMRTQQRKMAEETAAAALALSRKIKKEMAEQLRLERQLQAHRAKMRFEKGQTQYKENQHRLHLAETDRLRSEAEIANERREGTSMSKGGKKDFVDAMKKKDSHDDVEQFM